MRCLTDNEKKDIIDKMSYSRIEIDESLLNECYDEIYKLVLENISLMKGKYIEINNGSLITYELLKKLSECNKEINYLELYGHELSVDEYNLFQTSALKEIYVDGINDDFLEMLDKDNIYNYKLRITNKISFSSIDIDDEYYLSNEPTEHDLKFLSFYKKVKIIVNFDDYSSLLDIIDVLEDNNVDYTINLYNIDKDKLFEFLKSNENLLDNKKINCLFKEENPTLSIFENVLLEDFYKVEKKIDEMVRPALNLSPLEKYLFAYDITRRFRNYKNKSIKKAVISNEFDEEYLISRGLYELFREGNQYIVCAGYINLMVRFLNKLGINCIHYNYIVEEGFEGISSVDDDFFRLSNNENARVKFGCGHDLCLVNLVDPKYNVNGFNFGDPTNDFGTNSLSYSFSLMNISELTDYRGIKFDAGDVTNLMLAHDMKEFYEILYRVTGYGVDVFWKCKTNLVKLIYKLMNKIKELDSNCYRELYEISDNYKIYCDAIDNDEKWYDRVDINSEDFLDLIDKLGKYVVRKSNVTIEPLTIYKAYAEVLFKVYGLSDTDLEYKVNDSLLQTINNSSYRIPKRYIIDKDGNKSVLIDGKLKWEELWNNGEELVDSIYAKR